MQKSADAFRTISEVADDLSLPQHVLRFWETRFPQIRPLKRAGGRRYYRPTDVSLLRAIRQLLYDDGYTIKGVQRLLKEQGTKDLGSGVRSTGEPGISPELPEADDDDLDQDMSMEPIAAGENERAPTTAIPLAHNRDLVVDALATIDDCKRILDALLQPDR